MVRELLLRLPGSALPPASSMGEGAGTVAAANTFHTGKTAIMQSEVSSQSSKEGLPTLARCQSTQLLLTAIKLMLKITD